MRTLFGFVSLSRQLLQEFSEKIHEVARSALDEVVDGFLKANGIVADHRMTFMERTSLRSECRRLTQFLRLVDFIVVDTLRDLVRPRQGYSKMEIFIFRPYICQRQKTLE